MAYINNKTWGELIALAPHYKAIGDMQHWLFGHDTDRPWHLVTGVEPGGTWRYNFPVTWDFTAYDPETGMTFKWTVDCETSTVFEREDHFTICSKPVTFSPDIPKLFNCLSLVSGAVVADILPQIEAWQNKVREDLTELEERCMLLKQTGTQLEALRSFCSPMA